MASPDDPLGLRMMGHGIGVQSLVGGCAEPTGVFCDGECVKSNISSNGFAYSSRRVRCGTVPAGVVRKRNSINRSKEVWSPAVWET